MAIQHPPLRDDVIEAIFNRLQAIYGMKFVKQFDPKLLNETKRIWAKELAGISRAGLRYAMEHLPSDYPPNPLQIRSLAANRPPDPLPLLTDQTRSKRPGEWSEATQRVKSAVGQKGADPLLWARNLKAREDAGEKLKPMQARFWRQALGQRKE